MAEVSGQRTQPVPALRPELRFFERVRDGLPELLLEDPVSLRFYRVGKREHEFMKRLDGRRTSDEALGAANQDSDCPLTRDEAAEVLRFLYREGLLRTRGRLSQDRLAAVKRNRLFGDRLRRLNAIFFRIPLVNPDRLLNRLQSRVHLLLGPGALLVFAAILLSGLYQLFADPVRLGQAAAGVLYPGNWLWLGLAWLLLKLLHELFHGLVSKHYGGQIYEAGVVLVLFMPIGYVDATPSWRFSSRWQRIHTAAAGMIAELTVAGVAAWIWASLPPGQAADLAFNVVLIAAVSTLLFNANPLMRFDGYFILTDLVGIPNLYLKGQQYLRHLGRRYLLGMTSGWQSGTGPAKDLFVRVYGVLALLWRLTVVVVILVAAGELFYGLGIVLAVLGAIALLAVPVWRLLVLMVRGAGGVKPSPRRYLPRLALIGTALALLMTHLAWSSALRVPAVVRYEDREVVRVKTPGFVEAVHVAGGQLVKPGDPLVSLRNPELDADVVTLTSKVGEARIRARRLLLEGDLAAYQARQQELAALRRQLDEVELRQQELLLRAASAGRILSRRLPDLLGTYVEVGSELMSVVDEGRKGLRLSIAAVDVASLQNPREGRVLVTFPGRGDRAFHGEFAQMTPRATTEVGMPMLAAASGGPLPVRPRASDDTGTLSRDATGYEYLEPRVMLDVALDDADSRALQAGEVGVARLSTMPRPFGEHAMRISRDWFDHLLQRRAPTQ